MNRSIPFFNYGALFSRQETELTNVVVDVMRRGAYILQKDLDQFEKNLSRYLGVAHAMGVADGTNALTLVLMAAGIGPGDEVLVPAHTYVASAAAIHYAGATPVLVECGADHLMDAESASAAVTVRTRAIMPVQLNGRTANMDPILRIAADCGARIVEDAAQALGSKFNGRFAGTFGIAGTFSFYPAKLLGCFGDGGAVVTNDDEIARKIRLLRDHGRDENGQVIGWGTNCRLDNLQAAVLDFKLKTFSDEIDKRRKLASSYQQRLGACAEVVLPPGPDAGGGHFDVFQNYEIEAEARDELKAHLERNGVRTIVQFGGKAVHQLPGLGFRDVRLPFTERLYTRMLLLPLNTAMSFDDAEYVSEKVLQFYR
ncbi:MAG: DegT/DnrJ/EryC1/StrS family aminotransferase [Gammaproteobacteria bacterium]